MTPPFAVTVLSGQPGCLTVVPAVTALPGGRFAVRLDGTCVADV
ncbi:hypothetical protein [Actinophytocola sp.]